MRSPHSVESDHIEGCLAEYPLGCHGIECACPCHENAEAATDVLDWRTLAPPQEYHSCDCGYCDMGGDLEPIQWPLLARMVIHGGEYVSDRYLAIRADLAPVPEPYEGVVQGPVEPDAPAFRAAVTDEPPVGVHFRWQIIKAVEDCGWRLRVLEGEPISAGKAPLIAVVTAEGEHIGWACASRRRNDDAWSGSMTREYVEPSDVVLPPGQRTDGGAA